MKNEMPEPRLLRMGEAAALLTISRSKIYLMARAGEIPIIKIGGSLRVPLSALDRWLEQNTREAG